MRILKYTVLIVSLILLWTAAVNFGMTSGLLLSPIASEKTPDAFIEATKAKLKNEFVGNLAMVLLEDGKVAEDFYYSFGDPVNKQTLFQMASISKWVTAWGVFALVENDKLDLDQPVEQYLSRWQLPQSAFDNSAVTVRNLLSHTSGLTDGLGYAGFTSIDSIQTLEESLTKAEDAFASEGITKVGYKPNSQYKYSGGGYTLLQLVIEEASGKSFNDYMKEAVFKPLQMKNSTFYLADSSSAQLATFYGSDSTLAPHYRYTALAAASLYSNIEDLTLFLQANMSKNPVLKDETIRTMIDSGFHRHGLGPMIFGKKGARDFVVGHDGVSRDAINNAARINVGTNDGIVVFETGNWSFASELADEWAFWKTSIPNSTVIQSNLALLFAVLGLGYVTIVVLVVFIMRKRRKGVKVF